MSSTVRSNHKALFMGKSKNHLQQSYLTVILFLSFLEPLALQGLSKSHLLTPGHRAATPRRPTREKRSSSHNGHLSMPWRRHSPLEGCYQSLDTAKSLQSTSQPWTMVPDSLLALTPETLGDKAGIKAVPQLSFRACRQRVLMTPKFHCPSETQPVLSHKNL